MKKRIEPTSPGAGHQGTGHSGAGTQVVRRGRPPPTGGDALPRLFPGDQIFRRQLISTDGHSVALMVSSNLQESQIEGQIVHLRQLVRTPGLDTYVTGAPAANYDSQKVSEADLSRGDSLTMPILIVILLLVFGSVVAFSGFVMGSQVDMKERGFGLLAAIALDATLIRIVLVPSIMGLLGSMNWWVPSRVRTWSSRNSAFGEGYAPAGLALEGEHAA